MEAVLNAVMQVRDVHDGCSKPQVPETAYVIYESQSPDVRMFSLTDMLQGRM